MICFCLEVGQATWMVCLNGGSTFFGKIMLDINIARPDSRGNISVKGVLRAHGLIVRVWCA